MFHPANFYVFIYQENLVDKIFCYVSKNKNKNKDYWYNDIYVAHVIEWII